MNLIEKGELEMHRKCLFLISAIVISFLFAASAQSQIAVNPPASVDVGPPAGSIVEVSVTLVNSQGAEIDAFGLRFDYPEDQLDFEDIEVAGTLTQDWFVVDAQENVEGQIIIGGFDSDPENLIDGGGVLLKVIFTSTTVSGTGQFQLVNFSDDFADASTTDGVLNSTVPVELVSFSANVVESSVRLNWATASETNNYGFDIEKSGDGVMFSKIGFVAGNGTTTDPKSYFFVENNVAVGNHFYRLRQIDTDGAFEHSDAIAVAVVGPSRFSLSQNYPNPFNPQTRIGFTIPNLQGENVRVQLSVYNLFGQLVRTLVNDERAPGVHEVDWDGRNDEGIVAPAGMYFYTVRAGEFKETRRMLFLK
jgi:hypothetical protein